METLLLQVCACTQGFNILKPRPLKSRHSPQQSQGCHKQLFIEIETMQIQTLLGSNHFIAVHSPE